MMTLQIQMYQLKHTRNKSFSAAVLQFFILKSSLQLIRFSDRRPVMFYSIANKGNVSFNRLEHMYESQKNRTWFNSTST
ncbi:hypothetical protein BKA69DRAFT_1062878 [Paraphysoderma sedebokerense]|nr:hypothetical protein BKA69DRAFT_1062878 [Paraphysoderma sedebokerense]